MLYFDVSENGVYPANCNLNGIYGGMIGDTYVFFAVFLNVPQALKQCSPIIWCERRRCWSMALSISESSSRDDHVRIEVSGEDWGSPQKKPTDYEQLQGVCEKITTCLDPQNCAFTCYYYVVIALNQWLDTILLIWMHMNPYESIWFHVEPYQTILFSTVFLELTGKFTWFTTGRPLTCQFLKPVNYNISIYIIHHTP